MEALLFLRFPISREILSIADDWIKRRLLGIYLYFMAKSDIISARLEISFRDILHYTMA